MKKSSEKKIEKALGKKVGKSLEREIDNEVEERVEKQVEEVKKQVEKQLHIKLYEKTKGRAIAFKNELKKHTATAVTAAFAFLIALSWRTPIQNTVNKIIENLGLTGSAIYLEYLSAIFITIIAVLGLMWVSKWTAEDK